MILLFAIIKKNFVCAIVNTFEEYYILFLCYIIVLRVPYEDVSDKNFFFLFFCFLTNASFSHMLKITIITVLGYRALQYFLKYTSRLPRNYNALLLKKADISVTHKNKPIRLKEQLSFGIIKMDKKTKRM